MSLQETFHSYYDPGWQQYFLVSQFSETNKMKGRESKRFHWKDKQ